MAVPDRTQWTDPALNREIDRIYKQINGTPERMGRLEDAFTVVANQVQDLREEHEKDMAEIRRELKGSEWSRTQIIGAFATLASFVAAGAAVASVVFG
jgi:predicted  nucleic acid-binding Zn-ribbon protein